MNIRLIKIVLLGLGSLQALLYAIQNVVNLSAAHQTVGYVLSRADNVAYPDSLFPAITSSGLVWVALIIILIFEFGTGFVLAKGTFDLWSKRKGSAQDFNGAKNMALIGCGLGMITWFGLFAVIAGAAYQMWQTQIGDGSFDAAFQFTLTYGVLFLIVNGDDT